MDINLENGGSIVEEGNEKETKEEEKGGEKKEKEDGEEKEKEAEGERKDNKDPLHPLQLDEISNWEFKAVMEEIKNLEKRERLKE